MSDGIAALSLGNLYEALCNDRTSKGGTEEVLVFVHGTSLEGRPYIAGEEFLGEVNDEYLGSTGSKSLVMNDIQLVTLADIGADSDYFAVVVVLFEPGDNAGGVEAAGICQSDFSYFFCHFEFLLINNIILKPPLQGRCPKGGGVTINPYNSLPFRGGGRA